MSENLKQEVKEFKKKVKEFRKISSSDYEEGIKIANELISQVDKFSTYHEIISDPKKFEELKKTKSAFQLYIENVTNIQNFGKKWNQKKN